VTENIAIVVTLGIAAAIFLGVLFSVSRKGRQKEGEFLCDTCKYNDERTCSRPERPNATHCPEFKGR
jgi:hypothetical protein